MYKREVSEEQLALKLRGWNAQYFCSPWHKGQPRLSAFLEAVVGYTNHFELVEQTEYGFLARVRP